MSGPHAGRRGGRWEKIKANLRAQRHPCAICHQPIDYTLRFPDSGSFSVDHKRPLSTFPSGAEDPDNLRASHLGCNTSRGTKDDKPSLGSTSRNW